MSPKMDRTFADFERKPENEDRYRAEIVRDILKLQAQFAKQLKQPLARGTHAKGIAVRAAFEVLDTSAADRDPAMSARLAQGLFAHPGVYPATVRFANAASKAASDTARDVRAMSFAVEVPAGVLGASSQRMDFSLNSATTFPLNDAHAFAIFVRLGAAGGILGKLKALWSLSLREFLGLLRTAYLGIGQQRSTPYAGYEEQRYWSTVPFRHGPSDAAKYSATPNPSNPQATPSDNPNWLQNAVQDHVTAQGRKSEWDFGVQLLDAATMTHRGRKRDASFWVENAAIEWNEDQAPFHTVARLRLLPASVLTPEETAAQYIDVTTNCLPENQPLGGVNRCRWSAEHSSRLARQGGVVDVPAAAPVRLGFWRMAMRGGVLGLLGVILLAQAAGIWYRWQTHANVPALERVDSVNYLDQGWGTVADSPQRQTYYYTAQGASIVGIHYSWFVNVERPFRSERFADPDHLRQLNFIVDPSPTRANPDHLPVGFAKHFDEEAQDYIIDLTCAACHTGQLHVTREVKPLTAGAPKTETTAIRIDGGPAMTAITDLTAGSFTVELLGGLTTTLGNPLKFNRFANRVLGRNATLANKAALWGDVASVVVRAGRVGMFGGASKKWFPTQEGYGRTAAIGRIANGVFGDHVDAVNYHTFHSPESYPYLWNIWKFDWEQYGAFVAQPMARNAAEALGTGAKYRLVDDYGRPVPADEQYRTSFNLPGVERIEHTLRTLQPPQWPVKLLGDVNLESAARGRALFVSMHCSGCHGPEAASRDITAAYAPGMVLSKTEVLPFWKISRKPLQLIGTDPNVSRELVDYRVNMTRAGMDLADVQGMLRNELEQQKQRLSTLMETLRSAPPGGASDLYYTQQAYKNTETQIEALSRLDLRSVSIGEGLNILDMAIRRKYYAEHNYSAAQQSCFNGFGMLDLPDVDLGYKPRPLEGVWATAPFLHNGSVPTLYDLLSPAKERPRQFYTGSRDYDPKNVGYKSTAEDGAFLFDTALPGNSNAGHEFSNETRAGVIGRELTPAERRDIVEYLKIHRDDLDVIDYLKQHNGQYPPRQTWAVPDCSAMLTAAAK